MKKQQLIERIAKLGWGDVLFGYDKNGSLINVNDYNEETDTFNTYGEDMICHSVKFEELPQNLMR